LGVKHDTLFKGTARKPLPLDFAMHYQKIFVGSNYAASLPSDSIASLPDEKNESRDQANHDKHPVLAFETQKGKMLNQKLHRFRPHFLQNKHLACAV
jgi:hypothetical protein